ncbi:MAG TPA: phosphodiesterase [Rhodobacteraceae bacterium]|nr:phosphodiesterase [Paracoccaceae bacterium]
MFFAQISDSHVTVPGKPACGVAPTGENLARCVAFLNALNPRPELVLMTGDIISDGGLPQAREAARLLAGLDMPLFMVAGNHDERTTLRKAFGPDICPVMEGGFIQYAFQAGDVRFIALDSTEPGRSGGILCRQRLHWLTERLAEDRETPTVIVLHHPPVKFGVLETDRDGFEGVGELADILRGRGNIIRILCGHIHLCATGVFAGVPVSTAPSASGMRLHLDLTMKEPSAFHLDDPAFLVHKWTPDAGLITHLVQARDTEPLYLFDSE